LLNFALEQGNGSALQSLQPWEVFAMLYVSIYKEQAWPDE